MRRVRVGHQVDQPVAQQGGIGGKTTTCGKACVVVCAQEAQRQVDGGALSRHVVLQIGEQALVAQVELRGQREQQHVEVERREFEALAQALRPTAEGVGPQRGRRALVARDQRARRLLAQRIPTLLGRDHEPAQAIGDGAGMGGVEGGHGVGQADVKAPEGRTDLDPGARARRCCRVRRRRRSLRGLASCRFVVHTSLSPDAPSEAAGPAPPFERVRRRASLTDLRLGGTSRRASSHPRINLNSMVLTVDSNTIICNLACD